MCPLESYSCQSANCQDMIGYRGVSLDFETLQLLRQDTIRDKGIWQNYYM